MFFIPLTTRNILIAFRAAALIWISFIFNSSKIIPRTDTTTMHISKQYHLNMDTQLALKFSVFEVFLVCIFPHLDWIWRFTEQIFDFSPNLGKYKPEKLRIRTLITQCILFLFIISIPFLPFPSQSSCHDFSKLLPALR